MKEITSVAEQESDLTTIQSQPRIDGNLGGEYVQAGSSSDTVPELPASCCLFRATFRHAHSYIERTHTFARTPTIYLEIRCLGLVYCEPHKNSKLQVIGERLSVKVQKEKELQ